MRPVVIPHPNVANKARRAVWNLAWLIFYRPSPVLLHGWRRFVLRLFGAMIGPRARPYPSARIWAPWNLEMQEGSCIGPNAEIYSVAKVTLEPWSIVSQRAHLCSASHNIREPGFALTAAPIVIGRNAWVAADAFIGPGVVLAAGAVAGAGAVVMRDVAANSIVAGNPAVRIGQSSLADFERGQGGGPF